MRGRRPGASNIAWTEEEDLALRHIYAIRHAGRAARALGELASRKGVTRDQARKRAHRLGLSRVSGHHRPWTEAELDNLRVYAGQISVRKIARILGRSEDAVQNRLFLLQVSGKVAGKARGYTRQELADLLGIDSQRTFGTLLDRFPLDRNEFGGYSVPDVQDWIWTNLEYLELRKMNQPWLKQLLKEVAS